MGYFYFQLDHITRQSGRPPASQQAAYILREEATYRACATEQGWHARRFPSYDEDLMATGANHLPEWAEGSAVRFFAAADTYERANGRLASAIIATFPWELTLPQQVRVVEEWCGLQYTRHPYAWGIHHTTTPTGDPNQHVHILYSIRTNDGVPREPAQYFARWNAAHPARGGAQKDQAFDAYGLLRAQRHAWSDLLNWHLDRAGATQYVDPRSLHVREIPRAPEVPLPSWHGLQAKHRGVITRAWQQVVDHRRMGNPTHSMEQEAARAWWAHRQDVLGLSCATSHAEGLAAIKANMGIEAALFAHPGKGATAGTDPLAKHRDTVRTALHDHGKRRAMGTPATAQMAATAHGLALRTEQMLRAFGQEQERRSHGHGFGE